MTNREALYVRQGGRCAYCGQEVLLAQFNVDHIIPLSKGGKNKPHNKIGSCVSCNQKKADQLGWTPKWIPGYGYFDPPKDNVKDGIYH